MAYTLSRNRSVWDVTKSGSIRGCGGGIGAQTASSQPGGEKRCFIGRSFS
jgi:hypothetical protein